MPEPSSIALTNASPLETRNLRLVPLTAEALRARIASMSAIEKAQLSSDWLALLAGSSGANPWIHGFLVTLRETGVLVGQAGFKGPPGPNGSVEIAYGIDPEHQGRGFATEAAQALIQYASSRTEVGSILAHTLPQPNASTRVLTKCGFRHVGEVMDPDDGLVWRWELIPNEPASPDPPEAR